MTLPRQRLVPGRLQDSFLRELTRLKTGDALRKMWNHEATAWTDDPARAKAISRRLGWLSPPDAASPEGRNLAGLARDMHAEGLRDIVLLGVGGASAAAAALAQAFPQPPRRGAFLVSDSTDPDSVLAVGRHVDTARTLFVVASKSGKTIETLSQFFYFHERVRQQGIRPPGSHFIAITGSGSYLDALASEHNFLRILRPREDLGESYSALSDFGLAPAALWGIDVVSVLASAKEMREACAPSALDRSNPALELGALLAAGVVSGSNKLTILSTPRLTAMKRWIEQLIASSTGKGGTGILPVADVPSSSPMSEHACLVASIALEGEDDDQLRARMSRFEEQGIPFVEIRLHAPSSLGAEFLRWEVGTALACAALSVDPFDHPDVQQGKDNTTRILEELQPSGEMPSGTPRVAESGIELYASGDLRNSISTLNLADAARTLFERAGEAGYIAVLAYLDRNPAVEEELNLFSAGLGKRLGVPVALGFGPGYLHSIGQLLKGGSDAVFVAITSAKTDDLVIPGAKYTFGQLQMAQALGDLQALSECGKRVVRLHLTAGTASLPEVRLAMLGGRAGFKLPGERRPHRGHPQP